jgi:predicted nucleic acid-binding protein
LTLVVDASVAVTALIGGGSHSAWARAIIVRDALVAPHLMLAEATQVLRRYELNGEITPTDASRAHADLLQLPVVLYEYMELGERIWELRNNITIYDAWYVALAEALDADLATLDVRLARAPGARCSFLTPPM